MSVVDLDFPEVIFVKRLDGSGYGFFYATLKHYQGAAEGFLDPIYKDIDSKTDIPEAQRLQARSTLPQKAALTAAQKMFEPSWTDKDGFDAARCVAAACAHGHDWGKEGTPSIVVIESFDENVSLREGYEFLEHPGYPLAVIFGLKSDGGGECSFFDTAEEYRQVASKPPSARAWIPQLIYRLYSITPSIMTCIPTPIAGETGIGVECHAFTVNRKGKLVERKKR